MSLLIKLERVGELYELVLKIVVFKEVVGKEVDKGLILFGFFVKVVVMSNVWSCVDFFFWRIIFIFEVIGSVEDLMGVFDVGIFLFKGDKENEYF